MKHKSSKNNWLRLKTVAAAVLLGFGAAFAQNVSISGTVTDQQGEALIGVSVAVQGTGTGTITDFNGKYSISAAAGQSLVFSYVGYTAKTIKIGSQSVINVTLEDDVASLDEVVVVGYGVQKKSDVTGSLASVSEKAITEKPVMNAMQALQGNAAGVMITNNARPGELGTISIHGKGTPLYVVNGVPMSSGSINDINPEDITSMEILKDASSAAIYGSRSYNGVVLITTKKAEAGKYSVDYSGSFIVSNLHDMSERFSAGEFVDYQRWAYYYSDPVKYKRGDQPSIENDMQFLKSDPYAWANIQKGWAGGTWNPSAVETTDWTKYVIQTGLTQNHTIGIRGGTERVSNYVSVGYYDEKGTSQGQGFKRYTLNMNTTTKPFNWIEVGARVLGTFSNQEYGQDGTGGASNSAASSIYNSALKLYPYAVPYDDNGNRIVFPGSQASLKTVVDETKYTRNNRQALYLMANVYANIQLPLKGLTYKVSFGPSFRYRRAGVFVSPESAVRESSYNYVSLNDSRNFSWVVDNQFDYERTFGIHKIKVTLLQSAEKNESVGHTTSGQNIRIPSALWNDVNLLTPLEGTTTASVNYGSSLDEDQLASYMGRINYALMDKYLLTASIRRDGSSRLAAGHQWWDFPSVSLGWRMEQEEFIKQYKWISQLKLRLGYGLAASQSVPRYTTKGTISSAQYPYGDKLETFYFINDLMATATLNPLADPLLTWQKEGQFNVGLDYSFIRNRLSGSIDYYNTRQWDFLTTLSVPPMTGYQTTTTNALRNGSQGVDIYLNAIPVKDAAGFTWQSTLNVSWNKRWVIESKDGKVDNISDGKFIGYDPNNAVYTYEDMGIWRAEDAEEMAKFNSKTAPDGTPKTAMNFKIGQTKVKDQNGDYVIDANHDRTVIGKTHPSWSGGWTNTVSWKGLQLMVQMYGSIGYLTNGGNVALAGKYMVRKVDYYTEANPNAKYHRPEYRTDGSDIDPYASVNQTYSNASFINIRTISLSYNLPKKLIQNWGKMNNLRVYAQFMNPGSLYQSVKWKDMDTNSDIVNRNIVFGLNVGF